MKKIFALLLAVTVACGCTFAAAAVDPNSTYPSPTAPTIIPPITEEPSTDIGPTSPTSPSNPPTPGGPTTPSSPGTTSPSVTKPTTAAPATTPGKPTTRPSTTPGGSTVTGTAKPDTNPESPKTGDTGAEVFLFSAIAMTGAGALVLLRKKKEDEQ